MTAAAPFVAEPLPDQPGAYGIRNTIHNLWVARWDGPPARWFTQTCADEDAQRLTNHQRPIHCVDPLPASLPGAPDDLADKIRALLNDPTDIALNGRPYLAAIRAVLDEHPPSRIYGECGHQHADGEPGTSTHDEIGAVCEDGYQYTVCGSCCVNDYGQHQVCAEEHQPERGNAHCWPCPTVKTMARALGLWKG